ncbi:thyroid receptor-interacting protein 11 isoform X2 [Stomoxys calcitrans]|uniref:thyroid receptor-interacting protein 11 isoform X2 n=1 Tax=Stomoxys calcitrans TaxID=35570 RepID=UPI0027E237F7|nr:thyroid receptor-interacting protein 11 isoform X2 [Stomoxys calcitrans]
MLILEKKIVFVVPIPAKRKIVALRKQIETLLQNQISDSGGGTGRASGSGSVVGGGGGASGSGRTSKTPTDNNNATNLEDSWCWEPDNAKNDNDHSSETSSGNGNEIVNITLEEVPLGATAKPGGKTKIHRLGGGGGASADQQKRIRELEEENRQLNSSLEELDTQHNVAMQNMLELKTELQEKLNKVSHDHEALKKAQEDKFIATELEMAKLRRQQEASQNEKLIVLTENQELRQKLNESSEEVKRALEEMADLQSLLEKKSHDNQELILRIKEVTQEAQQDKEDLNQKLDIMAQELEQLKMSKAKKTSESSNSSSTGKQSEDEFIVVTEKDANSSTAVTPPSQEGLKDHMVELENRVSELTLENGSLSLKLQDREMEKEIALKALKENMKALQEENDELNEKLRMSLMDMEDQQLKIADLKEKAADALIAQEQLKALSEEKLKIADEIAKMKESIKNSLELEKRLLISEQEKEALQVELQSVKNSMGRINGLEQKIQTLTYENQQLKLNAEAETETLNNSNELEQKLKEMSVENDSLKTELERLNEGGFSRSSLSSKKQCVTDLDEDDDDDSFSLDRLKNLLKVFSSAEDPKDLNVEEHEKFYRNLREKLTKIDSLQRDLAHMSAEVMDLQDSKLMWDHEKKTLEADISQYILQCDELMKNNEILLNELENYKRNKLETIHENNEENVVQLETQLDECNKLNRTLEQEYIELNEKIEELEKENQALNAKLRTAQQQQESLLTKEKDLNLQVETLELEKCNLLLKFNDFDCQREQSARETKELLEYREKCLDLEKQLSSLAKDHADLVNALQKQKDTLRENIQAKEEAEKLVRMHEMTMRTKVEVDASAKQELEQKLKTSQSEAQKYQHELMAKNIVCDSLKEEIKVLQTYVQGAETLANEKLLLEEKLMEKEQHIKEFNEKLQQVAEEKQTLSKQLEEITTEKEKLETSSSLAGNETKTEDINHISRIAELEAKLLATADLQNSLDTLNFEKQELIKALQQKHAENMQYYMEIQRLTPLVNQTATQSQGPCEKCPQLEQTLSELRKQQEKFQDQINFLKEKSDILTTNLLTEQTNQKLVQEEKADVMEQNATLRKDVERLRAHLLEIEDMHTQETVEMQKELDETKARMNALAMEVSKSSNAYTSASIRANQHAETLQAQYALVVQQRDQLLHKLSQAEDRESKNQAALTNLQCALEQFQNDKENDIKLSTQRLRKELQQHVDKESQLHLDIEQLQQQLADATQGLNAAARLSDQLESCQQTINVLREEVETLKHQNLTLEQKLTSAESSQSDKIEKTLIKSLLIGYVVSTNPNDKQQILRMISSVLDFNQGETDKVGLNKQQGGWLGSLLGGGGGGSSGSHSKENLVQAFVQFLEQESQPQTQQQQMPNLLNITQHSSSQGSTTGATGATPATSRRSSNITNPALSQQSSGGNATATAHNTPVPIQPLLLTSTVLDDFSPTRNSSSILKDILSDS